MNGSEQFGIPHLRRRVDRSEAATEHNKIREAILSMQDSDPFAGQRSISANRIHGFEPISLGDTAGIGLHPGYVMLQRSPRYFSATSSDRETEEIMPTLGGTALNAATPPRESLSDGDWEAWLEFQEREPGESLAVIDFTALGAGPGTLRRDEKAYRLCSFAVVSNQITEVYDQFIMGSLPLFIDSHQWRAIKTGDDTIKATGGTVCWPEGLSDPIVHNNVTVADSGNFTVTVASSVWLKMSWNVVQQSTTGGPVNSGDRVDYYGYKIDTLYDPVYSLRTAAPAAGTNGTDVMTSGDIWWELFSVDLENSEVQVTDQMMHGPIFAPEIPDGKIVIS